MTDPSLEFDPTRICRETAVRRIELHPTLPSTNDLALELAGSASAGDFPLLVLAVRQTGGRGRGEHRWWASDGALTFSLVLDTVALQLLPRRWPRVSLATGIAVAETVSDHLQHAPRHGDPPAERVPGHDVRAKWPNDVFVGSRKICGILTENVARQPHRLVIGIGLNVNNSWQDAPADLQSVGTSLGDLTQHRFSLEDVLLDLLQRLHQTLEDVARDAFPLAEAWRARCMLEGNTVTVEAGGRQMTGVCHGIDDDGALLLHNESGIQHCVAGTVAMIR